MTDLVIRVPNPNAIFAQLKGSAIGTRLLKRQLDAQRRETATVLNEFRASGPGWCLTLIDNPRTGPNTKDNALWLYFRTYGPEASAAADLLAYLQSTFAAFIKTAERQRQRADGTTETITVPDDSMIRFL